MDPIPKRKKGLSGKNGPIWKNVPSQREADQSEMKTAIPNEKRPAPWSLGVRHLG